MKRFFLIFTFCCCFFFMMDAKASCTYTETARLKALASNVKTSYDYTIVDNKVTFNITFTNLHPDIYFVDLYNKTSYYTKENDSRELTISTTMDDFTFRYSFYSNYVNCLNVDVFSKYVTLPNYNEYSTHAVCQTVKEYSLCQRWSSHGIKTEEEFVRQIEAYKKSLIVTPPVEEIKQQDSIIDEVFAFVFKYYAPILTTIIIVCLILIYILRKKNSLDF